MCHLTPHASKNVKSRLPRNPTKFDVVAKSREAISKEKSVLLSKIYKHFGFSDEITFLPFTKIMNFLGFNNPSTRGILVDVG